MENIFYCGKCGRRIAVEESAAGGEVVCPGCGASVPVSRRLPPLTREGTPPPVPATGPSCPQCHQPLTSPAAVACAQCGYDLRSRQVLPPNAPRVTGTGWGSRGIRAVFGTVTLARLGAGIIALVVIVWSSRQIFWEQHPRPRSFSASRAAGSVPATKVADDHWTVVDCRLTAASVWWRRDEPLPETDRWLMTAPPARGPLQAAGRVNVQLTASIEEELPSLWPGAVTVELMRATASPGPFAVIRTFSENEVRQRFHSSEVLYHINGVRQPRCHFRYCFIDPTIAAGERYFYKLRFLGANRGLVAETGYCSLVALDVPEPTVRAQNPRGVQLQWTPWSIDPSQFLSEPRLALSVRNLHDLATVPVKTDSQAALSVPVGKEMPLDFSLQGRARLDDWSKQGGQQERVENLQLSRPVRESTAAIPADGVLRLETSAARGIPSGVYITTKPEDVRRGDGTFQLELRLPSQPTVATAKDATGQQRNLGSTFPVTESPGNGGRQTYQLVWSVPRTQRVYRGGEVRVSTVEHASGIVTAQVSAVRPPLPLGLRAVTANREVRLSWQPIVFAPADWVDGPFLVVQRADETGMRVVNGQVTILAEKQLCRLRLPATGFIDHAVQNGRMYSYRLVIEGTTRATSWSDESGSYECLIPVRVSSERTGYPAQVMAIPDRPRPVRMGVWTASTSDPRANAIQAQCFRTLRDQRWIELVERAAAASLAEEFQIAKLQSGVQHTSPAADLILECRVRRVGYRANFDVWLNDYRNERRFRLLSAPLDDRNPPEVAVQLLAALAEQFPQAAASVSGTKTPSCAPIQTVAIGELLPLSKGGLPAGEMETLLLGAVAKDECVKVVERETVRQAFHELALTHLTEPAHAARLGKLVTADAILTGYYGLNGEQLLLSARLIDSETGQIISVFELTGDTRAPQALCQQLADQVLHAAKLGRPATDTPLLRWMESRQYAATADPLTAARTAAYVAPESVENLFQLGQQQRQRGDLEEALGTFYNGLNAAESQADPWRFYAAIGELLEVLRRPEESRKLWQRAIADRQRRNLDASSPRLNLAQACADLHRPQEALAALRQIQSPDYWAGRVYEQLGRPVEAAQVYREGLVVKSLPAEPPMFLPRGMRTQQEGTAPEIPRLGPCYAALIRLQAKLPEPERIKALKTIIRLRARPLCLKAADELRQWRGDLDVSLLADLADTISTPWLRDSLAAIATRHPGTLEALRAQMTEVLLLRRAGDRETARRLCEQVAASTVHGEEAKTLRRQAAVWRDAVAPAPIAPAPPAVSASAPPARRAGDLRGDDARFLVDAAGTVLRVDAASGTVQWQYDLALPIRYNSTRSGGSLARTIERWHSSISDLDVLAQTMVLHGEQLFVTDILGGRLHAIDARTGVGRWIFTDWTRLSNPLFVGEDLYIGNCFGELWKLDAHNGQILAHATPPIQLEPCFDEDYYWVGYMADAKLIGLGHPTLHATPETRDQTVTHGYALVDLKPQIILARLRDDPDYYTRRLTGSSPNKILDLVRLPERPVAAGPHPTNSPASAGMGDQTPPAANQSAVVLDLAQRLGQAALPQLFQRLVDPAASVRQTAAECVGHLAPPSQATVLEPLLEDSDPGVRQAVIRALGQIGGPTALGLLHKAASSADPDQNTLVLTELLRLDPQATVPLVKSRGQPETYLKNMDILAGLCRAGDAEAWDELDAKLSNRYSLLELQLGAKLVAEHLPEPRLVPRLLDTLRRTRAVYVAQALGRIGDPVAIPDLIATFPESADDAYVLLRIQTDSPDLHGNKDADPFQTALEDLSGQSFGRRRAVWLNWWRTAAPSTAPAAATPLPVHHSPSIHICATEGDVEGLRRLLDKDPSLLDSTNDGGGTGLTPLGMAVSTGKIPAAEFLLDRGAKLETRWWINEMTPLLLALHGNQSEAAKLLVRRGADVTARDKFGHTALKYAKEKKDEELIQLLRARGAKD